MLSQNYLQYTEGNAFKVPVLRHNMTEIQLKSVASVIRMGFIQERIYPIKLVPSLIRMSYINDALEQYDVKQALNSENIKRILREVAHKEFGSKANVYCRLLQKDSECNSKKICVFCIAVPKCTLGGTERCTSGVRISKRENGEQLT